LKRRRAFGGEWRICVSHLRDLREVAQEVDLMEFIGFYLKIEFRLFEIRHCSAAFSTNSPIVRRQG
jgi:hypothetical protein